MGIGLIRLCWEVKVCFKRIFSIGVLSWSSVLDYIRSLQIPASKQNIQTVEKGGLEGWVKEQVICSDSGEKVLNEDMITKKFDDLEYIDEDSREVQLQVRH